MMVNICHKFLMACYFGIKPVWLGFSSSKTSVLKDCLTFLSTIYYFCLMKTGLRLPRSSVGFDGLAIYLYALGGDDRYLGTHWMLPIGSGWVIFTSHVNCPSKLLFSEVFLFWAVSSVDFVCAFILLQNFFSWMWIHFTWNVMEEIFRWIMLARDFRLDCCCFMRLCCLSCY